MMKNSILNYKQKKTRILNIEEIKSVTMLISIGTFDGLINIGIIERESHELAHIPLLGIQARVVRMLQGIGCPHSSAKNSMAKSKSLS